MKQFQLVVCEEGSSRELKLWALAKKDLGSSLNTPFILLNLFHVLFIIFELIYKITMLNEIGTLLTDLLKILMSSFHGGMMQNIIEK